MKTSTIICKDYPYKNNPEKYSKTLTIVIDIENWRILTPSMIERTEDETEGTDTYCLDQEKWKNTAVVILEQPSKTGRKYLVISRNKEVEKALKEALMVSLSFEEMVTRVKALVEMMKMLDLEKKELYEWMNK